MDVVTDGNEAPTAPVVSIFPKTAAARVARDVLLRVRLDLLAEDPTCFVREDYPSSL